MRIGRVCAWLSVYTLPLVRYPVGLVQTQTVGTQDVATNAAPDPEAPPAVACDCDLPPRTFSVQKPRGHQTVATVYRPFADRSHRSRYPRSSGRQKPRGHHSHIFHLIRPFLLMSRNSSPESRLATASARRSR